MNEKPRCACGRSVTGFCMGWHALSEEDCYELLERCEVEAVTEVPIEAFLRG